MRAGLGSLLLVLMAGLASRPAAAFDFDDVVAKAQKLAHEPYVDPKGPVPEWLLKVSYDQWRDIRFRPERSLWRDRKSNFEVQFFHPGLYYDRTVAMNVVDGGSAKPLPFSPSYFDYGHNDFASKVPQDLGFAGFRIHYPIKNKNYHDEVIVFLGASYFRALGRDNVFGLSARGVAVDTAESSGEEFPFFREFWLVRPAPDAKELTLYALLDSPSLSGAYRFTVQPGVVTNVKVDVFLSMRHSVKKLGISPLTSMFYFGENSVRQFEDFRPEVHDSDGLELSYNTGEWLWRPLDNPRTLHVSSLQMTNPQGFGLIQRDTNFDHHQDLETRSELRPSTWIAPKGDWGEGRVELVEIPTASDINDNIVTYWVPQKQPKEGETALYAYTMSWYSDDPSRPPAGRVVATRRDRGTAADAYRFIVDFAGKKLQALPPEQVLRGVVSIASGAETAELLGQQVVKNPVTGEWRLTFQVRPKGKQPVDLRAFLDKGGDTLTETWSYVLLP